MPLKYQPNKKVVGFANKVEEEGGKCARSKPTSGAQKGLLMDGSWGREKVSPISNTKSIQCDMKKRGKGC